MVKKVTLAFPSLDVLEGIRFVDCGWKLNFPISFLFIETVNKYRLRREHSERIGRKDIRC